MGRTYRFIARELKLKLMPMSPIDYIPRFCSERMLSGEIRAKAVDAEHARVLLSPGNVDGYCWNEDGWAADYVTSPWSLNPCMGCVHDFAYCYVPDVQRVERSRWSTSGSLR